MKKKIEKIVEEISSIPWKKDEYSKQNWGNWLHSVSSYVGRIKPAFAHWLIKICTSNNDVVLDPFCGIGTIPLEAHLLGRVAIGNDLNEYAYRISKAKFDINGLNNEIDYLDNIKLELDDISLKTVPNWVREYYHDETLKEILFLFDNFKNNKKHFLKGCLLGIVHGHRPQHLSIRTGYIIPYIPKPKPEIVYKEAIPKLKQKVKRMYKDGFDNIESKSKILCENSNNLSLRDNSVDVIISSPPYYETLDYVSTNKLRLWFCDVDDNSQKSLSKELIQNKNDYLTEMKKVGEEIKRILKRDGLIVFVLGDVHRGNKTINTALDIKECYEKLGFISHGIIEDEIPASRTTIVKYGGLDSINNKKKKLDRILLLSIK